MLRNYLLVTFRNLLRSKLYVAINIAGMAISIACCVTAFFVYEYDTTFDANHVHGASIYRVNSVRDLEGRLDTYGYVPTPLAGAIRENISDVNETVRYANSWSDFKVGDDVFPGYLAYVDPAFFKIFTFDLISGSPEDLKDKSKVFISEQLATRLFGSEPARGQIVRQVYGHRYREVEVAGVFRQQKQNSSFSYKNALMNFEGYFDEFADIKEGDWKDRATIYIQIEDPGRVDVVKKQLQTYTENNNKVREDFIIREYTLSNFVDMARTDRANGIPAFTADSPPISAVIGSGVMAVLILLIACFNLTNTSIAISSRRLKEIGVRKVMGGRKAQLVVQFIGETAVICLLSLALGLLLTGFYVEWWNTMWSYMKLSPHYLDSAPVILFLAGVFVFTSLAAGCYPAFYVSAFQPVSILKGKLKFGKTGTMTNILLGAQFAISMIGILSALAFVSNARFQRDYDLGFDGRGSIIAYVDDQGEFETYRNALAGNPDIVSIAGSRHSIYSSIYNDPVRSGTKQMDVDIIDVGDNYLETMNLTLIEGRDFIKDSETDRRESAIISEKMARDFGLEEPLGKELVWMDTVKLYVVGVIKDVYMRGLWRELEPLMIRYTAPENYTHVIVNAKAGTVADVNAYMESTWKEIFPNRLYNGRMLNQDTAEAEDTNNNILKMFVFVGIVALVLSATGLFSLASLNIIRRMKEIGVRKVMGASVINIIRIINFRFLVILLAACAGGCVMGYLMADSLMGSIWRYYQPVQVMTFVASVAVLLIVSAITVGYKVYAAAAMNPVNTLRDE